jgi:hypothetical protein
MPELRRFSRNILLYPSRRVKHISIKGTRGSFFAAILGKMLMRRNFYPVDAVFFTR